MNYISTFKLLNSILSRNLDPTKLLKTVDKNRIINNLINIEGSLPEPFSSTDGIIEEKNFSKMLSSDKDLLQEIRDEIKKDGYRFSYLMNRLNILKEKYPNVPMIYNYISILYERDGNDKKYFDVVNETIKKFPDYIFGKISLCDYYIKKNLHNKVPEVLRNKFNIYQHYPTDKEEFHVSEVRGFYSILGSYYIYCNKMENAYYCYFILCDIDNEHEVAKKLANEIVLKEVQVNKTKFDK